MKPNLLFKSGHVSGTGYFGLGAFTSSTGTTTLASGQGLTVGGSQLVVQQGSGNVGIGTTSPAYALERQRRCQRGIAGNASAWQAFVSDI